MAGRTGAQKKEWVFFVHFVSFLGFAEQFTGIAELRFEDRLQLRPNLITAAANARANRGAQIRRLAPEPAVHLADSFFYDAFCSPAPSRVKNTYSTALGINKDDGEAIGGEDTE